MLLYKYIFIRILRAELIIVLCCVVKKYENEKTFSTIQQQDYGIKEKCKKDERKEIKDEWFCIPEK